MDIVMPNQNDLIDNLGRCSVNNDLNVGLFLTQSYVFVATFEN